jgi:hypothetical protein
MDHPMPDSARRPISILAVANSLGMPYETVRRHVNQLVKEGRCAKMKGGVVFPASRVGTPASDAAVVENMDSVRRFSRTLPTAEMSQNRPILADKANCRARLLERSITEFRAAEMAATNRSIGRIEHGRRLGR